MTFDNYTTGRLAQLYDALNPPDAGTQFYLDLAGPTPLAILDMGCGTGAIACELAALGHRVTGADPAAAMLDVARKRPSGDKVTWLEADAAGLEAGTLFDLVIMTGHVFQVFLTDADIRTTLATLHHHLAPGGRIAFETRNPLVKPWERWVPEKTSRRIDVQGIGQVAVHHRLGTVEGELVSFDTHFRFADGEVLVAPSTLRFVSPDALQAFLKDAGFAAIAFFGNWDRSAFDPDSPEIIAVAEKN